MIEKSLLFTLGAGAGLTIAYLSAPEKGEKIRKKLAQELETTRKKVEENATENAQMAKEYLQKGYQKSTEYGRSAIAALKDNLEAIHN